MLDTSIYSTSESTARKVAIIDDHPFFASCLRVLLENESDFCVCEVPATAVDLPQQLRTLAPDLLVIDVGLGGQESGLALGRRLRNRHAIGTPILFVSTLGCPAPDEISDVRNCSFVPKTVHPVHFLAALHELLPDGGAPAFALTRFSRAI